MRPESAVWAIAFVVLVGLALVSFFHRRVAVRINRVKQLERTPEHNAKVHALREWLQEPRIARAFLDTGLATRPGLEKTLETVDGLSHEEVTAYVGLLVSRRETRQVIASYEHKRHGSPTKEVMAALLEWAGPVKQETLQ